VVGVYVLAGRRREAAAVCAHAVFELLGAGGVAEVRARPADVGDVALPERVLGHRRDLADDALVAAARHHAALVEGQRAEVAAAEAAAVVYDRKAHLLDGRDAAHGVVHRVHLARVRQLRHAVELLPGERHGGRVHHEIAVPMCLGHAPPAHRVVLRVLYARRLGVGALAPADLLEGGQHKRVLGRLLGDVSRAADVVQLRDGLFLLERLGDLDRGVLAHAVDQQVGLCVEDDAAADLVLPVVIVSKAAQAGLQRANDYGHVRPEGLPRAVCVDDHGPVRAQAHLFAG